MKIFVEQSGHPLVNLGDVSMLQVAITRLAKFWPDASFTVLTHAPEKLAQFCPNTIPMLPVGSLMWSAPLLGRLYDSLPESVASHWGKYEWCLRQNHPDLAATLIKLRFSHRADITKSIDLFLKTIRNSDLIVSTGGGYINNEFERFATSVLDLLSIAIKLKKPTLLLGQGIGPLTKLNLKNKARDVLPYVDFITLREKHASLPLLLSMGVSEDRMSITGDDAIELAYNAKCEAIGNAIGVNLRIAGYSGVGESDIQLVSSAVKSAANELNADLLPVPISEFDSDSKTIQAIISNHESLNSNQLPGTPIAIIQQISRCRVVVTGSYHAGVFALAQGIPVICLVKSQYYMDKFCGLAAQFGVSCDIVSLNEHNLQQKLRDNICNAWHLISEVRPKLLQAARQQVLAGQRAYQTAYDVVQSKLN